MGSEMCIRDRINTLHLVRRPGPLAEGVAVVEQALRAAVADL